MSKLKRRLALGGITGMLAALALAAPAQADKVVGACTVKGEAKMQDKFDPSIGVRISGGKGVFTFNSVLMICVGMSKGTPDAQFMNANAAGVFVSVVCGTGKAWGTITSVAGPTKYRNLVLGKKFAIHFLGAWPKANSGVFFWHKTKAPKGPDFKDDMLDTFTKPDGDGPKPKADKTWHPAGLFRLDYPLFKQPDFPNPLSNHCTKAMTIYGTVTVTEA